MIKWIILLGFVLSSCASQRQAEKYFDQHTDALAAYVEQNEAYGQQVGANRRAAATFYPPAVYIPQQFDPASVPVTALLPIPRYAPIPGCPTCQSMVTLKTVYLTDSAKLKTLQAALTANQEKEKALTKQLRKTQIQRDYWREMNRKKLWTLLAMLGFAMLYILFRVLAARVKVEEE